MSNVVAVVTNNELATSDPTITRANFTRIVYSEQKFFTYAIGEESDNTYNPSGKGAHFFMFVPNVEASAKPSNVDTETYDQVLSKSASGFVTAVSSIMPKIFISSELFGSYHFS